MRVSSRSHTMKRGGGGGAGPPAARGGIGRRQLASRGARAAVAGGRAGDTPSGAGGVRE
jgi:hypothetical protein